MNYAFVNVLEMKHALVYVWVVHRLALYTVWKLLLVSYHC